MFISENIYIGKSPYGTNGFRGCISDFNYNNVRTLDMAMGMLMKYNYTAKLLDRSQGIESFDR